MSSPPSINADLARIIVESAADMAIFTHDGDGVITGWNVGAENLFGWTADEAVGMHSREVFTPEDRQASAPEQEIQRARREGRSVNERWHIRKDHSRFWGSGLLMQLREPTADRDPGFVKIIRDRTTERETEQRYHAMTAALPGFVFVTDADGNNVETNMVYQAYTGRSAADLNGARWIDVLHDDDRERAAEIWGRAVAAGEPYEARYRFRGRDGEYRSFACRGVPERDEDGRIVRWLGTCIDVENEARARSALERLTVALEHRVSEKDADLATAIEGLQDAIGERQRAEDALRQAQKMEAVGQLTGGVAHDFNNLLTVIRGSADLLRKPGLSEDKRLRYVAAISETADRAAALTGQLLAFARRQPLQPEVFDVAVRIESVMSMLRTTVGSRIEIVVDSRCGPCAVKADPNQFDTALLNMTVNARDAMDGEGRLTLTISESAGVPVRRGHGRAEGAYVAVSVSDTGTGIPAEQLGDIFQPFYTTKEVGKGTGLGLSQVFGFAKQSGGDVVVRSEVGRGSTFTLYLPQSIEQPVVRKAEPADGREIVEGHGCILVVEDNETVGAFAAELLEELGYGVVRAGDAGQALRILGDRPQRFDALFTDVVMPGMSGIELAERLREQHPDLPVILTSGYSHVLAREGAHGFSLLPKPYTLDGLSRILQAAVSARQAGEAPTG